MAVYVPLNVNVFIAAYSGALAGMNTVGVPTDALAADYNPQAIVAGAFAQAVDTAWGAVSANSYDVGTISEWSANVFNGRNFTGAPFNTQANWTTLATALVAATKQGDTQLAAQNIQVPGLAEANRTYGRGTPTTPGQATITVIAAMKLIAKSSGLFQAWVTASDSAAAAADVVTFTVKVFTDNVAGTPLTLGNTTQVGFGSNGVAEPGNVAVANNGAFTASAGAGITITGGSAGVTFDTKATTIGTAAVGDIYGWTDIVGVNVWQAGTPTNEQIIPVGQTCLVTVSVTDSAAARALGQVTFGMVELP